MLGRAEAGHEGDLGAVDLGVAAVAAKLAHRLDDVVAADEVRLGQQAAVGVDRQAPARRDGAGRGDLGPGALLGEPEVLELQEHRDGEAVVDLGNVDVGGCQPGLAIGPSARRSWPPS